MTETQLPFPLPASFFDISPLGQVPVLTTPSDTLFPTAAIVSFLSDTTDQPGFDTQLLAALLSWTDSLVAAFYQEWSGLVPGPGGNALGFDPAARSLERVEPFLDWVTPRLNPDTPSAPEFALGCILWWIKSRRPIPYRNIDRITDLQRALDTRSSFQETIPAPWSPD